MKLSSKLSLIPIVIHTVAILAARLGGGVNGFGRGGVNGNPIGSSNRNGVAPNGQSDYGNNNKNYQQDGNNGPGSLGSYQQGQQWQQGQQGQQSQQNQQNQQGQWGQQGQQGQNWQDNSANSQGIASIVDSIQFSNQQVNAVNRAVRSIRAGGTIDHLDSTLQSLSTSIKTASTAINAAGSLNTGDLQSLKVAIQPLQRSIGTLVTQLIARKAIIAQLCACRVIEGAFNNIQSSSRVMFDRIKTGSRRGGRSLEGRGFNILHPLDSGIASFLNQGSTAFGFSNCIVSQPEPDDLEVDFVFNISILFSYSHRKNNYVYIFHEAILIKMLY